MSLQQKIFPLVEEWQQKTQEDPSVQTICGEGFLRLLVELRVIILQDAVFLKQVEPTHEMFGHKIFQCAEFTSFAEELNRSINNTTPLAEVEIQRVVPEINSRISDLSLQIQSLYRTVGSPNVVNSDIIEAISADIMKKMEERFGGGHPTPVQLANEVVNVATTSAQRRERESDTS